VIWSECELRLSLISLSNAEIGRIRAQHEIPDVANSWILGRCRIPGRQKSRLRPHEIRADRPNPLRIEEAGDAMRSLDRKGRVAWKATPRMLTKLADAEQEARDDLADW
jgi:hypothetical protein